MINDQSVVISAVEYRIVCTSVTDMPDATQSIIHSYKVPVIVENFLLSRRMVVHMRTTGL